MLAALLEALLARIEPRGRVRKPYELCSVDPLEGRDKCADSFMRRCFEGIRQGKVETSLKLSYLLRRRNAHWLSFFGVPLANESIRSGFRPEAAHSSRRAPRSQALQAKHLHISHFPPSDCNCPSWKITKRLW